MTGKPPYCPLTILLFPYLHGKKAFCSQTGCYLAPTCFAFSLPRAGLAFLAAGAGASSVSLADFRRLVLAALPEADTRNALLKAALSASGISAYPYTKITSAVRRQIGTSGGSPPVEHHIKIQTVLDIGRKDGGRQIQVSFSRPHHLHSFGVSHSSSQGL